MILFCFINQYLIFHFDQCLDEHEHEASVEIFAVEPSAPWHVFPPNGSISHKRGFRNSFENYFLGYFTKIFLSQTYQIALVKSVNYSNTKIVKEWIEYYNLTTEKYYDCFAEGVLTGSRLNNMYHIGEGMKYDSDERLISEEEEAERWAARRRIQKSR